MATPATTKSEIKLPPEVAAELQKLKPRMEGMKRDLAALKELGIDTSAIEDKLAWADKATEILNKQFT